MITQILPKPAVKVRASIFVAGHGRIAGPSMEARLLVLERANTTVPVGLDLDH